MQVGVATETVAALFTVCKWFVVSLMQRVHTWQLYLTRLLHREMRRLTSSPLLNFHTLLTAISSGANAGCCVPPGAC